MYLTKTPQFIQSLFPQIIWRFDNNSKNIFLSFDDGPNPAQTEWILETLDQFDAHAIFFCLGSKIKKYPDIFDHLQASHHTIANHGYHHISGWKTGFRRYIDNVEKGAAISGSQLFRPPFGQMSFSQFKEIKKRHSIVMWDVLCGDFDPKITQNVCLQRTIRHTSRGSIVVFHDQRDLQDKLKYILPKYLEHFKRKGFNFTQIDRECQKSLQSFNG